MATPLTYVAAPPRTPRRNTSLQVLPVIDGAPGPHLAVQFIPDPCVFPKPLPQDCWVTMGPAAGTVKTFGGPGDAVVSDNFGAYQGVECWLSGGMDTFSGVAERVLRAGEYRVVDAALTTLLAGAATSLGTATSGAQAVGELEEALAVNVPAQGYLFMGTLAATYAAAAGLFAPPGLNGELHTYLGTPVVVLTDPSLAATGYAAGPTTIWRGPIVATDAPEPELNTGRALAERLFAIAIECGVWKVTIPGPGVSSGTTGGGTGGVALSIGTIPASPVPAGTDVTVTVQATAVPTDEVHLFHRINGGAWTDAGEMTQVNPEEFVAEIPGGLAAAGDDVDLQAKSGAVSSPVITVEVT